jgi:FixJ family two-component response regulator
MSPTRQTICIIDDDESVRKALGRLIRSMGLNAVTFATAEEFFQCTERLTPVCLVVDVHLPGLSGLDLLKKLKAEGQRIPAAVITAYADEQVRAQALEAGAIAFLAKPFDEKSLLDAVARAVG